MYCTNCGETIRDGTNFCMKCGARVSQNNSSTEQGNQSTYQNNIQEQNISTASQLLAKQLSERERIAGIIWIVIACIQIIGSFFYFPASLVVLACGAWNIYAATTRFRQSKRVLNPYPGLVAQYDRWFRSIIITLIVNVIIGGVIGIVGGIYDLILRNFVVSNKEGFNALTNVTHAQAQYSH